MEQPASGLLAGLLGCCGSLGQGWHSYRPHYSYSMSSLYSQIPLVLPYLNPRSLFSWLVLTLASNLFHQ